MISAEQARSMEVELTGGDKDILKRVEESVLSAVSNGNNVCWFYHDLSHRAIIELKNLGYSVKNETSQRDGLMHKISW